MTGRRAVWFRHRSNDYGVSWTATWPHVSLGFSAHLGSRFGHVSLHLPIGVVIVGCIGSTVKDYYVAALHHAGVGL